jgi:succinyl-diaminopimelate desuccinylase
MVDAGASWLARAESLVSRERLAALCMAMVDIASPTGEEAALASWLASELARVGLDGCVQSLGETSANAHGRLAGRSAGGSLLLYAPIDTVTVGDAAEDVPWIGPQLRADMRAAATRRRGDLIVGLGAQNPKGHAACILAAAEALRAADVPLAAELLVGFGALGMPSNRRRPELPDGHGAGCAALVHELQPAQAVIAKSGWAISWEEVGLTWFEVEVDGTHTYVGSRHLLPYRSAIGDAAHIVAGLERWFEQWAETHRDGLVAPQGVVGAIEGGWSRMPAFPPAVCRFAVDLRLSPRTSATDAADAFGAKVQGLANEIGATARWRQTVVVPGTTTDPSACIVTSSIRAWESLTGRAHVPLAGLSGATDANILRALGVPTARVGLPKVSPAKLGCDVDFQLGMNAVDLADMELLTRLLIRIALDVCGVQR